MNVAAYAGVAAFPLLLGAQGTVSLPEFTIHSTRIANQAPAGSIVMPISALRFEPQVDIQARNLAEGQADVTLRGGIFENTGFQVGGVTVIDPQTGHYFAELPIAPAMLRPPEIVTGSGLALAATNATTGAIRQGWRRIRTGGAASVAVGEDGFNRQEIYQGYAGGLQLAGGDLGIDLAVARSESDGPIANGDHQFDRANLRLQAASSAWQTDLFAGYQAKFFGWPNLYTPFNSNESEDIETVLFALNHRASLGGGDFFEVGGYYRRNKDDYAFDRFAPVGPVHPFQHTTRVRAASFAARRSRGPAALNLRAEVLADRIESTSLTFGRYGHRTLMRFSVVPEFAWGGAEGRTVLKAGTAFDDTNRDSGAFSPVLEIARESVGGVLRRIHAGYTATSQVPTYTALNSNAAAGLFRGNPDLGRARSHNVEVGGSLAWAGWVADTALFWRRDDSLVDWTFRHGVTARTANAVDLDVAGFEAVARRSWTRVDAVFGYTYLHKDADYLGAAVDASFYALNYARHRVTAAMTVRLPHGFELRVDNVFRSQATNLLRVTGGDEALTTSAGLSYQPAGLPGLRVSAQIDNVWNEDFQEIPAVPATPRQASIGVAYHW